MTHAPVSHIPQKLHDDIQATLKTDGTLFHYRITEEA